MSIPSFRFDACRLGPDPLILLYIEYMQFIMVLFTIITSKYYQLVIVKYCGMVFDLYVDAFIDFEYFDFLIDRVLGFGVLLGYD